MMREILGQLPAVTPVDVVVALGGGGMAAGLVLGALQSAPGRRIVVHGVPVSKSALHATHSVGALLAAVRSSRLAEVDVDDALLRLRIAPRADACGPSSVLADLARHRSGVLPDPVFARPAWAAFSAASRNPGGAVASGGLPAFFDSLTSARR